MSRKNITLPRSFTGVPNCCMFTPTCDGGRKTCDKTTPFTTIYLLPLSGNMTKWFCWMFHLHFKIHIVLLKGVDIIFFINNWYRSSLLLQVRPSGNNIKLIFHTAHTKSCCAKGFEDLGNSVMCFALTWKNDYMGTITKQLTNHWNRSI